jgi:hypothetical protein
MLATPLPTIAATIEALAIIEGGRILGVLSYAVETKVNGHYRNGGHSSGVERIRDLIVSLYMYLYSTLINPHRDDDRYL